MLLDKVYDIFNERKKILGLDGLRAICVTFVIIHHCGIFGESSIDIGGLGVYIFFCISGYLIIPSLLGRAEGAKCSFAGKLNLVKQFYFNRFIRIFPVYYFAITFLVMPFFVYGLYAGTDFYRKFHNIVPYLYSYTTNYYVAYVLGDWPGVMSHFWSLAIEQQFYIIFPILFLIAPCRNWVLFMIVSIIILCVASLAVYDTDIQFHAGTMTGFIAILSGGVAATTRFKLFDFIKRGNIAMFIALLFCMITFFGYARFAILFLAIFFPLALQEIEARPDGLLVQFLENRAIRGIGVVSYGFYIYHNFMIYASSAVVKKIFSIHYIEKGIYIGFWYYALVLIIAYILTMAASVVSYVVLEMPLLRFRLQTHNQ